MTDQNDEQAVAVEVCRWVPVWEERPDHYVQVILSYTYHDDSVGGLHFWRGAGHMVEDNSWVIYGEAEEMGPFSVVAWMDIPDPPYAVLQLAKVVDCDNRVETTDEDMRMRNERRSCSKGGEG